MSSLRLQKFKNFNQDYRADKQRNQDSNLSLSSSNPSFLHIPHGANTFKLCDSIVDAVESLLVTPQNAPLNDIIFLLKLLKGYFIFLAEVACLTCIQNKPEVPEN